jgi:hypothetical protein
MTAQIMTMAAAKILNRRASLILSRILSCSATINQRKIAAQIPGAQSAFCILFTLGTCLNLKPIQGLIAVIAAPAPPSCINRMLPANDPTYDTLFGLEAACLIIQC